MRGEEHGSEMKAGTSEALALDWSARLAERAQSYIPGGVNSPVRAYRSVGGSPIFAARGEGSTIYDVDGNAYTDYVMSYGPLILGHAYPRVVEALERTTRSGTTFGAPTEIEVEVAEEICAALPSVEQVRLTNSGTEATMSAVRVARGYTGREKILKFEGNYHGHADALLASAGSGVATLGLPDSPGVTEGAAKDTAVAPYNDLGAVREIFSEMGKEIACVIVEPVGGNMGCVPPAEGFLQGLREVTAEYGSVLIFDEVMTGFRVSRGGAQQRYGITPDMTCLGKVIGGGLPVGAFGGSREIMEMLAPVGPVYQSGTLSGNPLAMAAGLATLKATAEDGFYERLEELGAHWRRGMEEAAAQGDRPYTVNQVGSMVSLFLAEGPVTDFASASAADTEGFKDFFWHMMRRGVYLAPSQYEAGFISAAHDEDDMDCACEAAAEWFSGERGR
ncbi:MAG: glutamate-1-semialdehyde 2,1-aminomutase [Rubrobacter sp.]|nr:glutamate-1-semialdehyde 2,1-aminomutase [Rubrobacter sp.]